MQSLDSLNDNIGTAIGIVGPAGSGKTVLGMRLFRKTYVIIADPNFKSGRDYLKRINETSNVIGADLVNIDDVGKVVPVAARYARFFKLIHAATENPDIDAIFVDSATYVTDYIIAQIVGAASETQILIPATKDSYAKWGQVLVTWRGLISQLRTTGKKLILSIHDKKDKDESDGIWKYELLIPGATKDSMPNMMSDMWRTEVVETNGSHEWKVRTLPNVQKEYLKRTYDLPAYLTQNDLVTKVRNLTYPPASK